MILVLGGTIDAREIAQAVQSAGYAVQLTTVTPYAAQLAEGIMVHIGALSVSELAALVATADVVIDATHPFAIEISRMAIAECNEQQTIYLRYERENTDLPSSVYIVDSAEDAAAHAITLSEGGTIFLTVGSKTLPVYVTAIRAANCSLVARVLPTASVLKECERIGLLPREIIAVQGPTCVELDAALLRHFNASVLVTKESGSIGGVPEKVQAASMAGAAVVVVRRPKIAYPRAAHTVNEVMAFLQETQTIARS